MSSNNNNNNGGKATTHGESDVYDRQIRLWGAEAQNKIRNTKVLYVNVSGVSSEIIKNLVLAGVHASICDGRPFPDAISETPCSFLPTSNTTTTTVAEAIQPHVMELNPLLDTCDIQTEMDISSIPDDYFQQYDIVIVSGAIRLQQQNTSSVLRQEDLLRISHLVTSNNNNGKFMLVDTFGM